MKKLLFAMGCLLAVCLIFSCGKKEEAEQTIKLGVAGAHSGDLASYGLPSVNAAKLVVKKINANGGVLGKQVELLVEDDVCKPEVAGNTATKLVSDGVDVVMGHICSGATKAALGIYKESKLVAMSPSATNPDLTLSGDYPNFFRTIPHDAKQAQLQVKFATQTLKVKNIVILHDKGDYGKGQAVLAKKYFEEAGVNILVSVSDFTVRSKYIPDFGSKSFLLILRLSFSAFIFQVSSSDSLPSCRAKFESA